MGTKIVQAGPRYVKTIEFVENLPAEESAFQDGEYQRLTASDKVESLRVKIEPYPDDLTLVDEIGNDLCKMKTWLVPGRKGLFCTVTTQIKVKTISILRMDSGISIIGVWGETLDLANGWNGPGSTTSMTPSFTPTSKSTNPPR